MTLGVTVLVTIMTASGFLAVLLAFGPGGQAEMSLIALTAGEDGAYVALHHLVRLVIVMVLTPILFRVLR